MLIIVEACRRGGLAARRLGCVAARQCGGLPTQRAGRLVAGHLLMSCSVCSSHEGISKGGFKALKQGLVGTAVSMCLAETVQHPYSGGG